MKFLAVIFAAALALSSQQESMDKLAERYVKLVLAMGQHDPDYVDAFYGPPEWRKQAEATKRPLSEIDSEAATHLKSLNEATPSARAEELILLRHKYLTRQLQSLRGRVGMLQGGKLTFDAESKA